MSATMDADARQFEMFESPIPPAVRRQGERADALLREVQASRAGVAPEPGSGSGGANTTPVVTPPAAPEAASETAAPETAAPGAAAPETAEANAPPVVNEPAAEPARDAAFWEQKFRSLQGRFDSQIPELTARARAAEAQITSLNGLVAQLRMQQQQQQPTPQAQAAPPAGEIPREDIEAYGEELISSARRWARSEVQPEIQRLRDELGQLRSQTQSTQGQLAQDRVHQYLDEQLPNWRQVNTDPGFIAWLGGFDPFSGRPRQEMLGQAYSGGDAVRTAAFFRAYMQEHTATTPAVRDTPAHTPAPRAGAGTVPLAELAAPGRGRPASPGAPADKRIWSHRDIAAFYQDVARGRYDGNPQLRQQLEADIHAAVPEGRIR